MKTRNHSILTAGAGTYHIRSNGSVVVCKDGAWPGMRIHFRSPTSQGFTGESSHYVIDGETYIAPDGQFEEFWITTETVGTTPKLLELMVVDCATPVVQLGRSGAGGWTSHRVGGGTIAEVEQTAGLVTLYADGALGGTGSPARLDASNSWSRGYIGGGCTGVTADSYRVTFWQHLDHAGTVLAEMLRFDVAVADAGGTNKSCSFEHGGRTAYHAAGSGIRGTGPLIPWPLYGLTVKIEALVSDTTDFTWMLYNRSEK
jgi:hypothetical protein